MVMDAKGRELWRKSFSQPFRPEEYAATSSSLRRFWSGDIDGDGHDEVLFVQANAADHTSLLLCLSDRGVEKWHFRPGKAVSSGKESFPDRFAIRNFGVTPLGKGGAFGVVVTAAQVPDYPDQVALLSGTGRLLGEYWHSGWLEHVAISRNLIYLGGMNNGYRAATLVVLGVDGVAGASVEENPNYQIQGFSSAHEKARILFPRSCINRKFEDYNFLTEMFVRPDSVTATVAERRPPLVWGEVHYEFTNDLKLRSSEFYDSLRSKHAELRAAGQLDHDLTAQEEANMAKIRVIRNDLK
jgi:hypothetical protein